MENNNKEKQGVLTIVRGVPGAGKSTFAHFIWSDYCIFEADKYFKGDGGDVEFSYKRMDEGHKWCYAEVEKRMIEHQKNPQFYPEIVVSNTSVREDDFKSYIELAEKYNFMVFSIIVENRHGGVSKHEVPEKTVAKMRRKFNIKL